jgi:hypothetical protein
VEAHTDSFKVGFSVDDRLFTVPETDATGDFKSNINPHNLEIVSGKCEPRLDEP